MPFGVRQNQIKIKQSKITMYFLGLFINFLEILEDFYGEPSSRKACHPAAAQLKARCSRAKRSDFRTEQQAFIALRILYGYSYGLNFVAQSPPSQSPAQSRSSSRKIRVLSDRMNVDKLSLQIQILFEEAFLVLCSCVFTKKTILKFSRFDRF